MGTIEKILVVAMIVDALYVLYLIISPRTTINEFFSLLYDNSETAPALRSASVAKGPMIYFILSGGHLVWVYRTSQTEQGCFERVDLIDRISGARIVAKFWNGDLIAWKFRPTLLYYGFWHSGLQNQPVAERARLIARQNICEFHSLTPM